MSRSKAQAIRQPLDRLKGQPQEREHSDGVSRHAGPTAPGEGFNMSCAKDRYPEGRDAFGSVTPAKAGGIEPGPAQRTRPPSGQ
jgi:hypothetical protein